MKCMAIKIRTVRTGQTLEDAINKAASGLSLGTPLRQIIQLKIQADGTVTNMSGGNPGVLNLGNQGEDWATVIDFDLTDLYTQGLLDREDVTNSLVMYYVAKIIVVDQDGLRVASLTVPVDDKHAFFRVGKDITEYTGRYEMIFTLQEKENEIDNYEGEIEVFVSSQFSGVVNESIYRFASEMLGNIVVQSPVQYRTLKKPTIHIGFNAQKDPILKSGESKKLGHKRDRFITDIELDELAPGALDYIVFFGNLEQDIIIGVYVDENRRLWVPEDVTWYAGQWLVGIGAYTDNGEEFYSNTITMVVENNFLNDKDSFDDDSEYPIGALEDREGKIIVDSQNNIIIMEVM